MHNALSLVGEVHHINYKLKKFRSPKGTFAFSSLEEQLHPCKLYHGNLLLGLHPHPSLSLLELLQHALLPKPELKNNI